MNDRRPSTARQPHSTRLLFRYPEFLRTSGTKTPSARKSTSALESQNEQASIIQRVAVKQRASRPPIFCAFTPTHLFRAPAQKVQKPRSQSHTEPDHQKLIADGRSPTAPQATSPC